MKIGIKIPSLKKSLKARTTGRLKRAVKKTCNPLYDKKGMGLTADTKKDIYNKVYEKVTIDSLENLKTNKTKKNTNNKEKELPINIHFIDQQNKDKKKYPAKEELLNTIPKEKQVKYFDKEARCCICNKDLEIKKKGKGR